MKRLKEKGDDSSGEEKSRKKLLIVIVFIVLIAVIGVLGAVIYKLATKNRKKYKSRKGLFQKDW